MKKEKIWVETTPKGIVIKAEINMDIDEVIEDGTKVWVIKVVDDEELL